MEMIDFQITDADIDDLFALVKRGESSFINEPHIGGGNPVVSSEGTSYFNDMLGTTVGTKNGRKYSAAALTAFGERLDNVDSTSPAIRSLGEGWFTGKPHVEGLGRTFLFRNYRANLAKWQTADPMGYPDGWNQLAYGYNSPCDGIDLFGGAWGNLEMVMFYFRYAPTGMLATSVLTFLTQLGVLDDYIDTDVMGLTDQIYWAMYVDAISAMNSFVKMHIPGPSGRDSDINRRFSVDCEYIVFGLGGGSGKLTDELKWSWYSENKWIDEHFYEVKHFTWSYNGAMIYSDSFQDPIDVFNWLDYPNIEAPGGVPYSYGHVWKDVSLSGRGVIYKMLE